MEAKILIVHAQELNPEGEFEARYSFKVYEFPNGAIMVPSDTSHDWFFCSRDEIEPCGTAITESVEDTGETITFSLETLNDAISGSIGEFGESEGTSKFQELLQ